MMNEKSDNTMKKQSRIRLWFQAAWFVLTNGYIRGYTKGQIFNGNTKVLCLPGLNCYSSRERLPPVQWGRCRLSLGMHLTECPFMYSGFSELLGLSSAG